MRESEAERNNNFISCELTHTQLDLLKTYGVSSPV